MAKNKHPELPQLDPLHPLSRRLMRRLQLFAKRAIEHCRAQGGLPPRIALLIAAGGILEDVCAHIRRSVPRIEYDEQAQQLIAFDGMPIGRLKRPARFPDQLVPMIEKAIADHLDGFQVDGDSDEAGECAPSDVAGLIEAES